MKITKTLLKKHKACQEGIDQFNALFPKGVEWKFNDPEFAAKVIASPLAAHIGWAIDHLPDFQPFHISTGNHGTVTAGYRGTATAGNHGIATAGDYGIATAGYRGNATAGDRGTATAGYCGNATAGDYGTATTGDYGTATTGYCGTATAGDWGTATAGNGGTATTGYCGTATAGVGGILVIKYYDGNRYRFDMAYVGENGILPNTPYHLDDNHNFVPK
jgi:hypothetical protein